MKVASSCDVFDHTLIERGRDLLGHRRERFGDARNLILGVREPLHLYPGKASGYGSGGAVWTEIT